MGMENDLVETTPQREILISASETPGIESGREKIRDVHISENSFDPNLIDFDDDDPENPLNWPTWRKWSIVVLVASIFMLANFGTIIIVPAVPQILREFHTQNNIDSTILVSIWELGEGFGPFLVGPLSERYGRQPVYHVGNVLFILCSVASALSINIAMLMIFRFLNGFVITAMTLGPSMVGDLFRKEERGAAMAVAIAFPLIGPFCAPIIGGFVAQDKGWRWSIWIVVIAVGIISLLSLALFRETYQVKILERKAERLRKSTGNNLLQSKHQKAVDNGSLAETMLRPLKLLFRSPIVFIISFYTAFVYGLSYLILTTLTEVMQSNYGFSTSAVGLTFLGRAIGNVTGMILYGLTSDRYLKYRTGKEGVMKPEFRLPLMLLGGVILPIGLFLYGWTAEKHVHWILPLIGTGIIGFSMLLAILPTENYLVDVYELHGASAVAAGVILRAIFGALLPLIGPPLYDSLGDGWGNSVLGFIAVGFIPGLLILMVYGERIRTSRL